MEGCVGSNFAPYTEKNGQMADLDFAPGFHRRSAGVAGTDGPLLGSVPARIHQTRLQVVLSPDRDRVEALEIEADRGSQRLRGLLQRQCLRPACIEARRATAVCHDNPALSEHGNSFVAPKTAFPLVESDLIANTFMVDKNYHPGYAQNWTTSIQETFARVYVLTVAYNGVKGTDLDVLQLPNRAPLGTPQLQVQSNLMIPNTE